jgi:hypothetical protein
MHIQFTVYSSLLLLLDIFLKFNQGKSPGINRPL